MHVFEELASGLHKTWTDRGRDERTFPELAREALTNFARGSAPTPNQLFRWLLKTEHVPPQFDPSSSFGNFALTVATREDFHIDVLVWTDSTTAIHQHRFSGAFYVLQGSSLHTVWSFTESHRWNDRLKSGHLSVERTELLTEGSTRLILPGPAMIHSLFHLDSPTVTVVVRTPSSAIAASQLTYERSGLAYEKQTQSERLSKVCQLLRTVWLSDDPQRLELTKAALDGTDGASALRIISSIPSEKIGSSFARLTDQLSAHDPKLASLLLETIDCTRRDRELVNLRRQTQDPAQRMLLAFVLNLPDRRSIDLAIKQFAPSASPAKWLWDTIRATHGRRDKSVEKSILGISRNKVSEEAIKLLLKGHSVDQTSKLIAGHDLLLSDARALCETLIRLPVLAPLTRPHLSSVRMEGA